MEVRALSGGLKGDTMSILNQIDTGKPCPTDVYHLLTRIEERGDTSMMVYITVSAWSLARVLDRLNYLERYDAFIRETLSKSIPYK